MSDSQLTKDQQVLVDGWYLAKDLENGNRVRLWWPKDEYGETWLLHFKNKEGEETKVALSGEAMHAIVELYARALRHQVDGETHAWTVTIKDGEIEASRNCT
jgi:cell division septal protein FtsQ